MLIVFTLFLVLSTFAANWKWTEQKENYFVSQRRLLRAISTFFFNYSVCVCVCASCRKSQKYLIKELLFETLKAVLFLWPMRYVIVVRLWHFTLLGLGGSGCTCTCALSLARVYAYPFLFSPPLYFSYFRSLCKEN